MLSVWKQLAVQRPGNPSLARLDLQHRLRPDVVRLARVKFRRGVTLTRNSARRIAPARGAVAPESTWLTAPGVCARTGCSRQGQEQGGNGNALPMGSGFHWGSDGGGGRSSRGRAADCRSKGGGGDGPKSLLMKPPGAVLLLHHREQDARLIEVIVQTGSMPLPGMLFCPAILSAHTPVSSARPLSISFRCCSIAALIFPSDASGCENPFTSLQPPTSFARLMSSSGPK